MPREPTSLRLDTDRFGPFEFRLGLDPERLALARVRVEDAHARFLSSPLSQVANRLEQEVLVASIHGTNTIEGAELSEQDTARILALDPAQVRAEQQRRVRNIKDAYDHALSKSAKPGWTLSTGFIREVHAAVSRDLAHPDNKPGLIRNNPKNRITFVGDEAHGGRYKPPQFGRDVQRLLDALVEWNALLTERDVPATVRAPLAHLYFERIHPFWDGNGRVGRVLEATLLRQAGFRYAPFAMSRYYLKHIDTYFALFNSVRKADEARRANANEAFVAFHLDGMLETINALHDRVNELVGGLLFDAQLRHALDEGRLNPRQYAVVKAIRAAGEPLTIERLRGEAWFRGVYGRLTDKTLRRDLAGLVDARLVVSESGRYRAPG